MQKLNDVADTGCPQKNAPMFAHFPSKTANMGAFFLGHPVHHIIISYHMSTLLTINTAVGVPSLMENVSLNQPHLSRIFPLVMLDAN